ncbi:ABC transporter ATP-binding protein [Lutispora saccharofermentans]|uniref:ATP-binding cassette domain-containing protein n=1 Tax=Lutispora saccharofermentans TaxID=3024236 RepID=A0ABT1NIT3_9FIRM|nr:ATP-binding cassette domain-containing protein [Lutispora saccharofermentans]MCQ1531188.1 ATP-binding cassette domain-containing protein [Lutispora saccharofermentans]
MIEVEALSKSFKVAKRGAGVGAALKSLFKPDYSRVQALENISFKIDESQIVGYIGPNGAGKSTTIKIISGILVPDSGKCNILGNTPWKNRIKHVKNIGVVFGQRSQLWWDVPVIDSYNLLKDIYKIPDKDFKNNLELLTSTLDLSGLLTTPVRQLSLGQRMRCEIAASLLHSPKILFLDEPTIGLDAVSKIAVRNFIKTINKEKKVTVILTTHDMNDIEALADRIILIGKGRLLLDGNLTDLKNKYVTHKTLTVYFAENHEDIDIEGTTILSKSRERLSLSVDLNKIKVSEVIGLLSNKLDIIDVSVDSRPIEEIIVDLYKEYQI